MQQNSGDQNQANSQVGTSCMFSGSCGSSGPSPIMGVVNGAADIVGKIWAAPVTIVGLTIGMAGIPFGGDWPTISNNAFVFNDYPLNLGGVLTLGNVILNPTDTLNQSTLTYAAREAAQQTYTKTGVWPSDSAEVNLGQHEEAHTYQYQTFGIFFLPLYLMSSPFTSGSPFERAADNYGQTGAGWYPF